MKDKVFTKGQIVKGAFIRGYEHYLTKGKEYIVVDYDPEFQTPGFTFPAYVTVIGDHGGFTKAHTHRFEEV
jgi:hypothetical protein